MNWDNGWGWGPWLMMFPVMLIFWGAVAWVIVVAIRHSGGTGHGSSTIANARPDALQILDERFARGEIDAQEYRERRDALRSG